MVRRVRNGLQSQAAAAESQICRGAESSQ